MCYGSVYKYTKICNLVVKKNDNVGISKKFFKIFYSEICYF